MVKVPFDIGHALPRIREAIANYPKAAMFELALSGFSSPFEQAIACVISIRTRDERTIPAARRLFSAARTAADMLALSVAEISELIRGSAFRQAKAIQIQSISRRAVEDYGGYLPCESAVLESLPGVGPKCAHLVLGVACGVPAISVESHVHRVTNRWGLLSEAVPTGTMVALERAVPRAHWIEMNELLVPFGKHLCTPISPRCSVCPVESMCRQVGVTTHR